MPILLVGVGAYALGLFQGSETKGIIKTAAIVGGGYIVAKKLKVI